MFAIFLSLSFYVSILKGSFKTKNRISHALDGLDGFLFVCVFVVLVMPI